LLLLLLLAWGLVTLVAPLKTENTGSVQQK